MNRKTLFGSLLRRMSALGCLLAVCVVTSAQDVIKEHTGEYFDRSIIRNDTKRVSIIYSERGSTGRFSRENACHGIMLSFLNQTNQILCGM